MDKIYTGNDRAKELHLKNYRDLIAYLCKKSGERWDGRINSSAELAAAAFVDWGRWAWRCECGNQMYAEPSDPVGFCDECGNVLLDGMARLVVFPDNRAEIEQELLRREYGGNPVLREKLAAKRGGTQLSLMPQFRGDISRSWLPGETVEQLQEEHRKVREQKEKPNG